MYCSNCGNQVLEDEKACSNCGALNVENNVVLMKVMLTGGLTRNLYYYKGVYYQDKELKKKYPQVDLIEKQLGIIEENITSGNQVKFMMILGDPSQALAPFMKIIK